MRGADAPETHTTSLDHSPRAHSPPDVRYAEGPRVNAARGVALGALVLAVAVVAVLLLRGDGGNTYKLRFQNAGQLVKGDDVQVGGRPHRPVAQDHADRRQPGRDHGHGQERLRAAARGHHGLDPRHLAVGHRQPLHRADAGAELQPQAVRRRPRWGPTRRRRSSTSTSSSTRSTPRRARRCSSSSRAARTWYDQRGTQANAATKYFNPALSASRRLVNELVANQQTLNAFLRNTAKTTGALAERRGDLPDLVSNTNTTAAAIAAENRVQPGAAAAARHAAQGQHDVREPARDARRPRRARRGVQARDQGPRALPARAAPAGARRAADDRRPAHARAPQGRRATTSPICSTRRRRSRAPPSPRSRTRSRRCRRPRR